MEVIEILSNHIDKTQNLINVEFRMMGDDDDMIREDIIEYSFFEEFGFDNKKDFETFFDEDDIDDWDSGDDDYDYIDEDELISFLNEYYIIYPKKIPKSEFK